MIDPIREAEVEASIAATNAECEAEELARVSSSFLVQARSAEQKLRDLIALPKDHPARFHGLWCSALDLPAVTVAEARTTMFAFFHPFGADLAACTETNS